MRQQLGFATESLRLREFTRADIPDLYSLTRQTDTEILPDWNMSEEEIRGFLEFVISSYDIYNPDNVRILLAIEHKQDRKLIGWCGVFPNDMLPQSEREVAYAISKDYRKRGYTTEAVQGMTSYVFHQSNLQEIVAIIKPFNAASRRVLEKSGFAHQKLIRLSDNSDYNYFILQRGNTHMMREIREEAIEPYLDILAEVEHVNLNRSNPEHEQWLRRRIGTHYRRGAKFYGYQDEAGAAAGIIVMLHEEAPAGIDALGARAEVLDIGVSKQHRRKGIGSILLKHAEAVARSRRAYCMFMMTYAEDYDVIAFYGKNGFVPVATIPDVFGPDLEGTAVLRKVLR